MNDYNKSYEELELIMRSGSPALRAASWAIEAQETTAAYRIDTRLRSLQGINRAAVDAIIDLDDYITARSTGRHPAVVAGLRALQDTTANCSQRLLALYMIRPL